MSTPRLRNQVRRVTGPAISAGNDDILAGHCLCDIDHLTNRVALAGTEIQRIRVTTLEQITQRQYVRLGEIAYMNVITYAGSILRRIVLAKYRNIGPTPHCRIEDQRNQVSFRIVVLANFGVRICSCRIKIPQSDGLQPVSRIEITQHLLNHQLRMTIGVYR